MTEKSVDIRHLESVIVWKLCPKCAFGVMHEAEQKVYRCDHSGCEAVFDYSPFSDSMIDGLLQRRGEIAGKDKKV